MHFFMFSMLFVAVVVITLVMFVFWVILLVMRGVSRLFLGPGLKTPASAARTAVHFRNCPYQTCKTSNPVEARFCRRCGRKMDESPPPVRRAAIM